MTKYREILRLYSQRISGRSISVSCGCSRNTVTKVISRAKELNISWPLEADVTDADLQTRLFPQASRQSAQRKLPDAEHLHRELMKSNVTLKLLWTEYCEDCRMSGEMPLMYSQFCFHFQKFSEKKRASMHIQRKPAEQIEVDWAGKTASIVDRDTGEIFPAYIFVGVLSYSQYAFVEATLSQNLESWIGVHVNMYRYFGGSTKILVPDNLKTGVEKADWYTPTINRTYHEMSEHYTTAVIPARVRKPKDYRQKYVIGKSQPENIIDTAFGLRKVS